MIDREAIVTCSVQDVREILDESASEVLTPHNRARVLSIELRRVDVNGIVGNPLAGGVALR